MTDPELSDALKALPSHDVRPQAREAIRMQALQALADPGPRGVQGLLTRLRAFSHAVLEPGLATAASCIYLGWAFLTVSRILGTPLF